LLPLELNCTGGANGIGAATVGLFAQRGALIVFGDLDATSGEQLARKYGPKHVQFLKIDVTKYEDNVALFRRALDSYGRVDHAFSIAGIVEQGNIFDPAISLEDVAKVQRRPLHIASKEITRAPSGRIKLITTPQPPASTVLDVNLLGPLYFARIAAAYLHHNKKPEEDKSIVLLSSVAGFIDSPGLFAYGVRISSLCSLQPERIRRHTRLLLTLAANDKVSKHGVLGLLRCLRTYLPPAFGIRINAVAPLATTTALLPSAVTKGFKDHGFPLNTPEQVADVVLGLVVGSHKVGEDAAVALGQDKDGERCNGLTIYVEGGRGWEVEEGLNATRDQWLGKGPNERLTKAVAWLASVSVHLDNIRYWVCYLYPVTLLWQLVSGWTIGILLIQR